MAAPRAVGGIAGGEKYIAHGILFKYCVDVWLNKWFYGGNSDEPNHGNAIKASGTELRGLNALFECNIRQLCMPLMAMIDFRGFRLAAMSLLPISQKTIRYGSSDGGKTIHNDIVEIHKLMKEVGGSLNLAIHHILGIQIYGPRDIEIHFSEADS